MTFGNGAVGKMLEGVLLKQCTHTHLVINSNFNVQLNKHRQVQKHSRPFC